jgi:hypothetical protein
MLHENNALILADFIANAGGFKSDAAMLRIQRF